MSFRLSDRFVSPADYGPYSFFNVPGTILSALTPETPSHILPDDALEGLSNKYDKVVLFLVDGLGWDDFLKLSKKSPFLRELCGRGSVLRLATQFPSTTACNITTINTALSVARHGVYEWFYYEPKVGEIIAPLLYSSGRQISVRGSLWDNKGVKPEDIYPRQSIYRKLVGHGVKGYAFQDHEYVASAYTDAVFDGASRYGFVTPADGLVNLAHAVIDEPSKAYYYFYFDKVDSLSHLHGPGSKEVGAETEAFLLALEHIFWEYAKNRVDHTLFILTADHGQTVIDPDKCIYLNLVFPELEKYIKRSKSGSLLAPAGSCRDMFLYMKEGFLDDACHILEDGLRGRAVVAKTRELIENGYFGEPHISEALAGRLGNLVILPLEGQCVWWYEKDLFEVKFLGHHGGLTKKEMEIPFLAWDL